MENAKEQEIFLRLGKLCNSTFGTTGLGNFSTNTYTHNVHLNPTSYNTLHIKFQTMASFSNRTLVSDIRNNLRQEGLEFFKIALKNLKEAYEEAYDESINFSIMEESIMDNVEFTSYHISTCGNQAFYYLKGIVSAKTS